jgi:hypothetical protein
MVFPKKIICASFILILLFCALYSGALHLTPLEKSAYMQQTSSSEISAFLSMLSHQYASAEKVAIAESELGNPIDALLVSSNLSLFKNRMLDDDKLTVMVLGSQHGTEPSGAEALLRVARDILKGTLGTYQEEMNFIFIPNCNPDGRNLKSRKNGNGVDINRNYMILSESESRGIINALHRWSPDVVLDVHEAAALKKKSLSREGYLMDFEAQFEAANNPNVDQHIRNYSFRRLLPQLIEQVEANGLPAQRYIKSIRSIHQPVTNGRLSLRILRNMAGMMGAFSFLLENRRDPSTGFYPTPQNIHVRVSKQYLCITAFLDCLRTHRDAIRAISRKARMRWKNPHNEAPLYLASRYVTDPSNPKMTLPLRRIDTGASIKHAFRYNGAVETRFALTTLPDAYIITSHQNLIQDILARHHVRYKRAKKSSKFVAHVKRIKRRIFEKISARQHQTRYVFKERKMDYQLRRGDIVVDLNQPARRIIPLFLELQSAGSIFNNDHYNSLVQDQKDFFVLSAE